MRAGKVLERLEQRIMLCGAKLIVDLVDQSVNQFQQQLSAPGGLVAAQRRAARRQHFKQGGIRVDHSVVLLGHFADCDGH